MRNLKVLVVLQPTKSSDFLVKGKVFICKGVNSVLLPFWKGFYSKKKEFAPFRKDTSSEGTSTGMQTESHKSCLPFKSGKKNYQVYPVSLNLISDYFCQGQSKVTEWLLLIVKKGPDVLPARWFLGFGRAKSLWIYLLADKQMLMCYDTCRLFR